MKLSDLTAKLTCTTRTLIANATRALAVVALAGAALAAAPAAHAQRFAVGVQIGGPRYYAPAPPRYLVPGPRFGYGYGPAYGPGYWERRRFEDWRAHERFEGRGYYGPYGRR